MNKIANIILAPGSNSVLASFGLLLIRVWLGAAMCLLHGWSKLTNFEAISSKFMSFAGLPPSVSLGLAVFAEFACAALVAVGLGTRITALFVAFTMGVAFLVAHGGALTGENSGEMAFLYLGGFLTITIAGPGQFSFDALLFKRKPMA